MPKLEIIAGPDAGLIIDLTHRFTTIGRQKGCEIVLDDTQSSRKHTKISYVNDKYVIEDLESRNGTYLNGNRVEKAELKDGDEIQIGNTYLRFKHVPETDDKGKVLEPILATKKSREIDISKLSIRGYEIVELIGKGGMGYVCKARQLSMDRIVAIKVLHEKFVDNPEFVARFISEARAAGKLNHPNVIQVHDVGQYNNIYFFSMEFLDGRTVLDMLREKKYLPVAEAVRIVLEIAKALDFAHKHHIVHRDVKPDNIMVTPDGKVKLADLGISKAFDEGAAASNVVLGSPHYMSPEQAMGTRVDGRADIYSLGATFYHMIVGDTPFSGVSVSEILKAHVAAPLPGFKNGMQSIPSKVSSIIQKMLAKKPEERFQSAKDLIVELERIHDKLSPKRTLKADLGLKKLAEEKVRESSKKQRVIFAIVAVVILAIAAASYAFFKKSDDPAPSGVPTTIAVTTEHTEPIEVPQELKDKYAELQMRLGNNDHDKARELCSEILERWPEHKTYTDKVAVDQKKLDQMLAEQFITELSKAYNQLLHDLLSVSLEERLQKIQKFRAENIKTFARYGEEKECKRIITLIDELEANTKREHEKAIETALERLRAELEVHLDKREYFTAEQKVKEFRVLYNSMYGQQIDSLLKKLIDSEEKHFKDILAQADGEAAKNRISLAIVLLKDYIKAQEGRPYVAQAREALKSYTAKLDAVWGRAVKVAETAERDFDFGTALREYDALKRQVDLDEERLKDINRLIEVTNAEFALFNRLKDTIKSKAPITLTFDITGDLKSEFSEWSITDADNTKVVFTRSKGITREIKWSVISGSAFEKLVNKVLGTLKTKSEIHSFARMLRLKGEVMRADELEATAK